MIPLDSQPVGVVLSCMVLQTHEVTLIFQSVYLMVAIYT